MKETLVTAYRQAEDMWFLSVRGRSEHSDVWSKKASTTKAQCCHAENPLDALLCNTPSKPKNPVDPSSKNIQICHPAVAGRTGTLRLSKLINTMIAALVVIILSLLPAFGHDVDIDALSDRIAYQADRDELLLQRAQLYRLNGQPKQALADLERIQAQQPGNPDMQMERALVLADLGRDSEAEAILDKLIADQTGDLRRAALCERAVVLGRNQRLSLAIRDLNEVIAAQPALQLYLIRGDFQEKLGKLAAAAKGYRAGLAKLGGKTAILKERLFAVEIAGGNYAAALELVDEHLAQIPVKTSWLLKRAEVLELLDEPQQADAVRQEALAEANRVLEKRFTAMNRLTRSKVYIASRRYGDAYCELQRVVAQAPQLQEAQQLFEKVQPQTDRLCSD